MAKIIDYSKWNHIEISDDEDDTHPNIDTPSLFRWRHQARLERMEENKKTKEIVKTGYEKTHQQKAELQTKINEAAAMNVVTDDLKNLKMELEKIEQHETEWIKKEEDLRQKEKLTPWNIDTLCQEGSSKTIVNKYQPTDEELTDEQRMEKQKSFTERNESLIKKFGMMKRYEDSEQFLSDHADLTCEETANYLVIWCINLQVQEKFDLMSHVAHQTIVMQFILELARSLKVDARACVRTFFSRIKLAEKTYMDAFNDELESFKQRIRVRAEQRLKEAEAEAEEEERLARLGPGGLDPVEVLESLPKELQECFHTKDLGMLETVLTSMPSAEANDYLKKCIDSGLWVPDASTLKDKKESNDQELASAGSPED